MGVETTCNNGNSIEDMKYDCARLAAHTLNPGTQEAKRDGSVSLRPAWSVHIKFWDSQRLHRETCLEKINSQTKQKKKKKEMKFYQIMLEIFSKQKDFRFYSEISSPAALNYVKWRIEQGDKYKVYNQEGMLPYVEE